MRHLLVLSLMLAACASEEQKAPAPIRSGAPALTCNGQSDPACALVGGAMLLIQLMISPPGHAERSLRDRSIFGRCEELDHGNRQPCARVSITVRKGAFERKAWVEGYEFEINGLARDTYSIEAESENYAAIVKIAAVKTGQ